VLETRPDERFVPFSRESQRGWRRRGRTTEYRLVKASISTFPKDACYDGTWSYRIRKRAVINNTKVEVSRVRGPDSADPKPR